jgi:hypothetical protein
MVTNWKVCFGCKKTTPHVELEQGVISRCVFCGVIREENRVGERMPEYLLRGSGILCDDGTKADNFPILLS